MKCLKIKSYDHYWVSDEGVVYSNSSGELKPLVSHVDSTGYPKVTLCKNGVCKTKMVHRLVAGEFLENPYGKPTVNHKNSKRDDNRVSNLEWATYSENNKHAFDHGLNTIRSGEDSSGATISNETARAIYKELLLGGRNVDVAIRFNVTQEIVANIKTRKHYVNATSDLPKMKKIRRASKLSDSTVSWICQQIDNGLSHTNILNSCTNPNIKRSTIKDISRGSTYRHISNNFKFSSKFNDQS